MSLFTLYASDVFFLSHALLFFLLRAALFTYLYKHHEAAMSLEHIYHETP
jgi:hypothetical protein